MVLFMRNIEVGKLGESLAESFLTSQNYKVLAKNFRGRFGEVDLVCRDLENGQIVFVEVKTRTGKKFGVPEEAITYSKKEKLIKTSLEFLNMQNGNLWKDWRMDLIAVKLDGRLKLKEINHIKNILDGNGS